MFNTLLVPNFLFTPQHAYHNTRSYTRSHRSLTRWDLHSPPPPFRRPPPPRGGLPLRTAPQAWRRQAWWRQAWRRWAWWQWVSPGQDVQVKPRPRRGANRPRVCEGCHCRPSPAKDYSRHRHRRRHRRHRPRRRNRRHSRRRRPSWREIALLRAPSYQQSQGMRLASHHVAVAPQRWRRCRRLIGRPLKQVAAGRARVAAPREARC